MPHHPGVGLQPEAGSFKSLKKAILRERLEQIVQDTYLKGADGMIIIGCNKYDDADSLDDRCHRYFGSMFNMTWLISRSGIAVCKSDWTDAGSVMNAITGLLTQRQQRQKHKTTLSPFRVERLEYRERDKKAFIAWLEKAGKKAVQEYTAIYGSD